MTWQELVLRYGQYQPASHLALIVGQSEEDIVRFKANRVMGRSKKRAYVDVFIAFHGHPPQSERDWPRPRLQGSHRSYEWLPNELSVLASLVGRLPIATIARILSARLRLVTGDAKAERKHQAVQLAINRIGMQSSDFVGGISIRSAARKSGETIAVLNQAVHDGTLKTMRVGLRHVIALEELERWTALRDKPPAGWVRLTVVAKALQIRSDSKLPEYAKAGYIPDTVFVRSCHLWFIAPGRAQQIIADARAGRPLPWHGKPFLTNLRASWKKWQQRKHRRCALCVETWGPQGPPRSFAEYCQRYPALDLGLKRHLTVKQRASRTWKPRRPWGSCRAFRGMGKTFAEAARELQKPLTWLRSHVARGTVRPLRDVNDLGSPLRISAAGMKRLRAVVSQELRGRPRGHALRTWLGLHAAADYAGVSIATIQNWDANGSLKCKRGPRGRLYSQESVTSRARHAWLTGRIRARDAEMPAWLVAEQNGAAA